MFQVLTKIVADIIVEMLLTIIKICSFSFCGPVIENQIV